MKQLPHACNKHIFSLRMLCGQLTVLYSYSQRHSKLHFYSAFDNVLLQLFSWSLNLVAELLHYTNLNALHCIALVKFYKCMALCNVEIVCCIFDNTLLQTYMFVRHWCIDSQVEVNQCTLSMWGITSWLQPFKTYSDQLRFDGVIIRSKLPVSVDQSVLMMMSRDTAGGQVLISIFWYNSCYYY